MGEYSPHRAIIGLGALLIAVAVASGTLGVVNANRAERSASTLTNRYLVLLAPVRDLRASVARFQVVVEETFASASFDSALLAATSQEATRTDEASATVGRLLAVPANATLAPRLASVEASFVAARTGLAALVGGTVRSPRSVQAVAVERAAGAALDTALGSLQSTITARLVVIAGQARDAAAAARDDLLWCLAIGLAFAIAVTAALARKAMGIEREAARHDTAQAVVSRRSEFEGRLQRALEMSKAEAPLFELVAQALGDATPGMRSELLLADSSRAHFRRVLTAPAGSDATGCEVVSPEDCPAAGRGQTMVFPDSTAIDACPNLRGRARSALCVPVSISGNSVGVFHVTAADGSPPDEGVRRDVEVVARRASERLAMLRAFEMSQTQANTDSLTGLLTRRSLESRIRALEDSGVPYAVAYGDLDHFKQLNDVFGHDAGDRALRTFSQVLRDSLRPADVPCRYGGEEFVIVLPACGTAEAIAVLERVRQHIADRLVAGRLPTFTVSFGLASSEQAAGFEAVVTLADHALLQAKNTGRDRIVLALAPEPDVPPPGAAKGAPTNGGVSGAGVSGAGVSNGGASNGGASNGGVSDGGASNGGAAAHEDRPLPLTNPGAAGVSRPLSPPSPRRVRGPATTS